MERFARQEVISQNHTRMNPKRLLMIGNDRLIFQEGSVVRARQVEYAKNYDEVHIIVFSSKEFTEQNIAPNCWVYPTRSVYKILRPFNASRLAHFVAEKRKITEVTCQDASLTAIAGISVKKKFGLPLELQLHEDIGSPYFASSSLTHRIRRVLALSNLPKADHIRVVSNRIAGFLKEKLGIDPAKIEVRPIVVDTEWIKNAPIIVDLRKKYPQFEKIVLMASRLEPEKNVDLAIRAFKEVVQKIPKAGLIIVGKGSEQGKLEMLVKDLNLSESIKFEPWADRETLASYYKTADIYLNTSLFEGYGMTFVESKAAGCRVVSTDVGVAKEQGAMIVEHEAQSVADGIIRALTV